MDGRWQRHCRAANCDLPGRSRSRSFMCGIAPTMAHKAVSLEQMLFN
jgi:hypothetical protein